MDKQNIINKKQKRIFHILSSEITAMNNFKKKEDSRRNSEQVSFSESNSSKGIKIYNFNKLKKKDKIKLKTKYVFLSDIDNSEKKRKENLKNKLINQKKYLSFFNSNKKQYNKKKANFFQENKLNNNNIFTKQPKKIKNSSNHTHKYYNISILQKFNKDLKKYFYNDLESSKNEIQKSISKIKNKNKTFYKLNNSLNQNIIKNIKNTSSTPQKSQKSFSSISNKSKENNMENKILRTKYSSNLLKINKNYKRKRNLKQYIDEKKFMDKEWNSKIGIIKSNIEYNSLLSNDIKFQSGSIKDELCLLFDDIHYYRQKFSGNNDLFSSFKNMTIKKQVEVNKSLEESCALLHYIPKIILKEYYNSTDKFISIEDPSREMFSRKVVYNELETFQDNLKYLYKISNFIKCCGEVYSQLIEQVEGEMAITSQNFLILKEILKRIRYLIINLTNISKNILINYCFDKYVIINKFKNVIKQNKVDNKRIIIENNIKKVNNKRYKLNKGTKMKYSLDIDFHYEKEKTKKNNRKIIEDDKTLEEKEDYEKMKNISKTYGSNNNYLLDKMTRISKALELNKIYDKEVTKNNDKLLEKKDNVKPMACINSKLMDKMLKYMNKDVKEQIISLRTCERHLNFKVED